MLSRLSGIHTMAIHCGADDDRLRWQDLAGHVVAIAEIVEERVYGWRSRRGLG
jgi:hypothetical protein